MKSDAEWAALRQQWAKEREARRRRAAIRKPPAWPYASARTGICRMCGEAVRHPRRTWCSDECVYTWSLATDRDVQLHHLVTLHGCVCWECGAEAWRASDLDVDHRRPLWSLTDEERQELRWWLPFNLQLLCLDCHAAKTKREAGERALLRRR